MNPWFETLANHEQEKLFAWMRKIGDCAMREEQRARELSPPPGCIAVGAGAFDHFVRGASMHAFLAALRQGKNPVGALETAKDYARVCVEKHNAKRLLDVNWQRWEGTADAMLEELHRSLQRGLEDG